MATQAMFLRRHSAALALLGWSALCGAAGQLDPDGLSAMDKEAARRAAVEPSIGADWQLTRSVEAGVQIAGEGNLFWKLSNTPARDPDFDFRPYWYEFYVKPGLGFKRNFADGRQLYARVSAVASGTVRHDPFGAGDTGRISIEEFVAGIRMPLGGAGVLLDLSAGAQNFTLGTGMLIANGGSNGFDRGALKLGPRKAFQNSVVARVSQDAFSAQAFYLDPNENPDNDSGTRLVGVDASYTLADDRKAGIAYGKVPRSRAAYPQAALGGIGAPLAVPDARKDLQFVYGYARVPLLPAVLPKGWFGVDARANGIRASRCGPGAGARKGAFRCRMWRGRRNSPWATRVFPATIRALRATSASTPCSTKARRVPGPRAARPPGSSSIPT
ncbi:hypothetical protein JaAD80_17655 [Janthinobacterium sp. AD80]|nr:hypothetical protein [Janthinobacterium sp. AD80]PMQ15045.1 hypothetical protein JaAD80_17655 [Janthinobacterium sp. AD80]